ncbi:MAG: glycosyl transferase [Lachnospiraceae bacterium]|nr:glycosyl transferase [Lachnospiraceae bacterium]
MIGTEFLKGQGLGNQLFVYVTARAIALERGCVFGTAGREHFANNIHSNKGMYFMDVDLGEEITPEMAKTMRRFDDDDTRLYLGNSRHDMTHGAYISGANPDIHKVADNTLLYGNLQDESYFAKYKEEIKQWLHVKEDFDSYEYTRDNLCIINMRGGEYTSQPELYLDRRYFLHAIANMKKIRPDMEFMIVTEDEEAAKKVLPEYECHHFDMGKDYVTVKNARYLILSNSSFAILPVITSETLQYAIAPKYWARHNVSDGYWASEQNIYSFLHYQDRAGRIVSPEECRQELEAYKKSSPVYARRGIRPGKARLAAQKIRAKYLYGVFYCRKIVRSLQRRAGVFGNRSNE